MGSPLSPVVANIFMEAFETTALDSFHLKPKVWFRYVDDTFIIWPHGLQSLLEFKDHLNNQHSDIKFTMEIENNGSLPFLDVLVSRNPDGSIAHSVYRKPTHTDRYLHASSHHHPSQKLSVINSLVHRAFSVSQGPGLKQELNHVTNTLLENGYNKRDIQRVIFRHSHPRPQIIKEDRPKPTRVAFLPYIQGVTDRIGKILRKNDIKSIFQSSGKISQMLPSPKDSLDTLSSKGVYRIPCTCGLVYIGETGRSVGTRITEHKRSVKTRDIVRSALSEHNIQSGHKILFDESTILAKSSFYYNRKIREGIEIFKHPNNINRDQGWSLSPMWQPIIAPLSLSLSPSLSLPTAYNPPS